MYGNFGGGFGGDEIESYTMTYTRGGPSMMMSNGFVPVPPAQGQPSARPVTHGMQQALQSMGLTPRGNPYRGMSMAIPPSQLGMAAYSSSFNPMMIGGPAPGMPQYGAMPSPSGAMSARSGRPGSASQSLPPVRRPQSSSKPAGPAKVISQSPNKKSAATLGVIRLDYDYPPAPGDIDSPESFAYDVYYRVVPGLTFTMCQSGKLTADVRAEFLEAVDWLVSKGVSGITGDCGFMMYFQALARQNTKKPVFMSALAQLPAVTCAFSKDELICIMTANGATLRPMRSLIKDECGVDPDEKRYIIVGCEDIPGFEAVAEGGKVDVEKVTPGMVKKAKQTLRDHPGIRAFLLECTELPPYADAIRQATGLPVFDAITCCDYFMASFTDNKRFGINDWQNDWDGQQADYQFGKNLTAEDRAKLVNKVDPNLA